MFGRPTYKIENDLRAQGFENVVGMDEAGRGAWAGPVVAAAVVLPPGFKINGLNDSKLLTPAKRAELYPIIVKSALAYGTGVVSEKVIDREGIISATRQAFLQALDMLRGLADYLLVDGTKIFPAALPCQFIVKGDQRVASIAAASIIAKVTRDNLLNDYHRQYPVYGFDCHKGYGTSKHRAMIDAYGYCPIHRLSFEPLVDYNQRLGEEE